MRCVRVSIVVCTHNRAGLLPRLVARLREELVSEDGEIIVVDSASTDETRHVVAEQSRLDGAPLRYLREEEPGLSVARNRGVAEAHGGVVAFLDDDALPEAGWLSGHLGPYGEDERVGTVGGPIDLLFEPAARPRWLSPLFEPALGRYDLGPHEHVYDAELETPSGGNMSFRREALADVGGFRVELGKLAAAYSAGEEFELVHRLFARGWRGVYSPRARVLHVIGPERLRLGYFRNRFLWNWRTNRRLAPFGIGGGSFRLRRVAVSALYDLVRVVGARSFGDRVYHLVRVEAHVRFLLESLRRW
jgi:glycosyltransferase involved in cell wall biosynthesis